MQCTHLLSWSHISHLFPSWLVQVNFHLSFEGVPDPPQNLALQANSTSPVLSWQRPPNIPEDVLLTYHLQITNLTSIVSEVFNTTDTWLFLQQEENDCSLFEFSVTASNDVGNSTSASIMETVPISKFCGWNKVIETIALHTWNALQSNFVNTV